MSDKESNKHGAKPTVLYSSISWHINLKKKKRKPHTLWIRVKLGIKDFTLLKSKIICPAILSKGIQKLMVSETI